MDDKMICKKKKRREKNVKKYYHCVSWTGNNKLRTLNLLSHYTPITAVKTAFETTKWFYILKQINLLY